MQLSYRENKPYIIYREASLNIFCFFTISVYGSFFCHHHAGILLGILLLACNTLEPVRYLAIIGLLEDRIRYCDRSYLCDNVYI